MYNKRVASARQVFLGNASVSVDDQTKLEKSFFKSISLPNGTHKTTAPHRLTDVDQITCNLLANRKAVRLLDVGISSGITTLELLNHFESRGIDVSGIGVDICIRAYLRSFLGIEVLSDPEGNVLQVATPFFARGRPHPSQESLQSKVLGLGIDLLESSLVRRGLLSSRRSRALKLVSPRLLDRNDFQIVEHDVALCMREWDDSFDLVRAANVLNVDYFSPSHVGKMVLNLASWLKEGGLLAICRTNATDGSNHGSFYCKQESPSRLQHVHRMGQGYELEYLIDELFCKAPQATNQREVMS